MKEKIKSAIEVYNKIAKIYADYTFNRIFQFQLNKFISMLPKNANVLDAGCGSGRDTIYLKEEGLNVIGIDDSKSMLNEAKKRVNANLSKMNILNLDFKDKSFDGVWCMATLADIEKNNNKRAIKEFNRVLKKDGLLYVAVKEGDGEKFIIKEEYDNIEKFYSFYRQQELEALLTENGFQILNSTISNDKGIKWVEVFAKNL